MSGAEKKKEASLSGEKDFQETRETPLSGEQTTEEVREAPLSEEKPVEGVKEPPKTPEPTAAGNENITILKHDIYRKGGEGDSTVDMGVELAIKNVLGTNIAAAVFEAVFYDIEGNILDTVEHKTIQLRPDISRTIRITSLGPESDKIKSYCVRLIKTTMTPVPTATGDEKIKILKHSLSEAQLEKGKVVEPAGAELAIRNVSDKTIASAVFEAVFYDIEGNILDTVKHSESDLKPSTSRAINVNSSVTEYNKVKSYDIKITRTTTADVEKVQLRRHEIRTTEAGEEEVRGIVKNISEVKTDAALVATFYNPKKGNISTKVIILRDIEPNTIRQYAFKFKPQEGDIVSSYTLNIGELAE